MSFVTGSGLTAFGRHADLNTPRLDESRHRSGTD